MKENVYDAPHEAVNNVKRHLLASGVFEQVKIEYMALYSHISPVYEVDPIEKITDAYLDQ